VTVAAKRAWRRSISPNVSQFHSPGPDIAHGRRLACATPRSGSLSESMMQTDRDARDPVGTPEARYANVFTIGHNALEFVFDFGQRYSRDDTPSTHTRIVTNPSYARALLATLSEAIAEYERRFGVIPER
jgi:hypothetical protein